MTAAAMPQAARARADARDTRPAIIRVEGLVKRFAVRRPWAEALRAPRARRWTTALGGVSLDVRAGEILGLLGPNGAGKTTLVKILSTLVVPDEGRAEVDGCDVVGQPAATRRVLAPVTADERSLDWRLSARENLRFFGALHGLHGPRLRERIEEVLTRVALHDAGNTLVGTYSSGMKQRLLIARALVSRPRVLLLDEPTRSLDPLAARSFRAFLRTAVAGEAGCTILLATHDAEEALELSDRIAVLGKGRLLAVGTPAQVAARFVEDRYRAWVAPGGARALAGAADALGLALRTREEHDEDGWLVADLEPAGDAQPVSLLAALVEAGVPVARFEKVRPSLADLMERVLRHPGSDADA